MNAIESYNAIPVMASTQSILTQQFKNEVADIIVGYELIHANSDDCWNRMIKFAEGTAAYDAESYARALTPGEVEVLEFRKLQGENVQTKSGKWKVSKVCTNSTYSSNKSVISKALEAGVSLRDENGDLRSKKALADATKEAGDEKTPEQKVTTAWATFTNLLAKCDDETRRAYASLMAEAAKDIAVEAEMAALSMGNTHAA